MPTSLYNTQFDQEEQDSIFLSSDVLPTDALFPPELTAPFSDSQFLFENSSDGLGYNQRRGSFSSNEDSLPFLSPTNPQSMSSTSPRHSLSPLTGESSFHPTSHSPHSHSSASPLSSSGTDDVLLARSFEGVSGGQLDMFLLPEPSNDYPVNSDGFGGQKSGQSLFLPGRTEGFNGMGDEWMQNLFKDPVQGNGFDDINQQPQPQSGGFDFSQILAGLQQQSQQQPLQQLQQQVGQTIQPQMVKQEPLVKQDSWGHEQNLSNSQHGFTFTHPSFAPTNQPQDVKSASIPRTASVRRPTTSKTEAVTPAAPTPIGKHNKTERRYRQKVQAAQADLRDAIPALRLLYGTSTPEQLATTDIRAPDGTVDGLGEVTRPNASAKATILIGARVYIELLQKRSAKLQRMVNELETFRRAVEGEAGLAAWKEDFGRREAEIERVEAEQLAAKLKDEEDESEGEDDDADEEPTKKRKRTTAPRAKPKAAVKTKITPQSTAAVGARVFAAFAMSFSFVPSASTVFRAPPQSQALATDKVLGHATNQQILARVPLIVAEHTSRLLARSLPSALVPVPATLLEWVWRLVVAVVLAVVMRPIISKWTTKSDEKIRPGTVEGVLKDVVGIVSRKKVQKTEWERFAAGVVGGANNASTLARWHTILHLNFTASSPYSLALLALLQPEFPPLRSPQQIWFTAQSRVDGTTPPALVTVLGLPLHEALRCLSSLPPTSAPLSALAEQITLIHVHDLYTRFFIHLVEASTSTPLTTTSLKSLLSALESHNLGANLKASAFDKEIKSVMQGTQKGSVVHALGLVLIGLWGIFTGPSPSAQASLAAALATEQASCASHGLSSVSALLELLYPGCAPISQANALASPPLSPNAQKVDTLALSIIEYLSLLLTTSRSTEAASTDREGRKEESLGVQRKVVKLRGVLNKTGWVGVESEVDADEFEEIYDQSEDFTLGDEADKRDFRPHQLESERIHYERAKERLVDILAKIGRRAAGRASGRDEDSGLEGDLDEL
ncbi:uncharacterized protein IAS62_005316 [Cryptococcus decagattii]|uniref:BHLH domain-containing protein n=1 Tax=Cryptococcus decagattii TaxID=1859122 RepID=A0ABZ2B3D6_9TREE